MKQIGIFLKEKWQWVLGAVLALISFFTLIFNRKLRAKVAVLKGEVEDATLKERQSNKQAELDKLNTQLDNHEKPEVKDEEDIDKLADYFNRNK